MALNAESKIKPMNASPQTGEGAEEDHRLSPLTVLVEAASVEVLDKSRHLVPLTLGPEPVELRCEAELGERDPGCHRRSVPVVAALSGHDGSDCGLRHKRMCNL